MCSRTLLLLCTVAVRTTALAPSFDTFSAAATGSWHGTLYEWPGDTNGAACESVVDEVMRSCGGAVQGVRVDDGPLLNRQDDGFCTMARAPLITLGPFWREQHPVPPKDHAKKHCCAGVHIRAAIHLCRHKLACAHRVHFAV